MTFTMPDDYRERLDATAAGVAKVRDNLDRFRARVTDPARQPPLRADLPAEIDREIAHTAVQARRVRDLIDHDDERRIAAMEAQLET